MQALKKQPEDDETHQYRLAQQIRTLSLPGEMGEHFKCIALSKNNDKQTDVSIDTTLIGFEHFDQRFRL